jgi:hypothetical protein
MDQSPPLPRRVAWFAPWTWRPWKRWALVGIGLAAYLLAAAPTEYLLYRVYAPRPVYTARAIVFEPALFVLRNSRAAMQVFVWELTVMDALFGKSEVTDFYSGEQGSEDE